MTRMATGLMGVHFELDGDVLRFVSIESTEYPSGLEVLRSGLQAAAEISARETSRRWHLLFDVRASTNSLSTSELRGISGVLASHRSILSGRCAVSVADSLHYGLARMLGVFLEGHGMLVGIFHELEAARAWLAALDLAPPEAP